MTNVGWQDAGIYLCQLAVHPPSLIWTRLDIDPPVVHILDSEEAPVWELHYDVGTTVEMVCRVKRPPLQGKNDYYLLRSTNFCWTALGLMKVVHILDSE